MLTVLPSWLAAVPRTTARIRSPSRSASGSRLSSSTTQPSPETNPSASTSKLWHRPVGDSMPCSDPAMDLRGSSAMATPPARARSLSPSSRLRQAWWTAIRPDEHAVSIVTAGPCRPEGVGHPTGGEARVGTAEPVGPLDGVAARRQQLVVAVGQADEDAGPRAGRGGRVEARVFERIPRRLQQQPVLRVDRDGLALGHAEEVAVEAADVVEEGAPPRDRPAGDAGLGVVVRVRVPAVGGNLADQVVAAQQRLPQQLRGIDASGKSAGHADDGNGRGGRVAQVRSPCSRSM